MQMKISSLQMRNDASNSINFNDLMEFLCHSE